MCAKCGKIIPYGNPYCVTCQAIVDKNKKDTNKDYNRNRRDKDTQKFYDSKPWRTTSKVVKARDKGLCMCCLSKNRIIYYNVVHHIVPIEEDNSLALDINNLICLCHSCHAKIHAEYKTKSKIELQNRLKEMVGAINKV